jgi:hypothetical protein
MSMTAFQREGLRLLGYTEREGEFLFFVATHSGYFTNHQFKSFMRTESASVSHGFIRKLLERKHVRYRGYRSGERVYHLFARKVYQAIERENLRTRKKHELEYVKTRLVTLDFVLAHPQHRYLETEGEKVRFFETECNIDRAALPVKLYRARKSAAVTPRHFVDRFPLFVSGDSGALAFTYVDSGSVTLDGFATHLRSYLGLFQALPAFEFIYIAPTNRFFQAAESVFQQIVCGRRLHAKTVTLLEYFRLQKAWDAKERVASQDVILLKEAQGQYSGKHVAALYERWRDGRANDSDVQHTAEQFSQAKRIAFRTLQCGASLKVFADPHGRFGETWTKTNQSSSLPQNSESGSAEISG